MMTLAPPRPALVTAGVPGTRASAADRKSGFYRHDLDGLRGVAIALVAVFHVSVVFVIVGGAIVGAALFRPPEGGALL